MKVQVIFDVLRHGLKDGDQLTSTGVEQVITSARANLAGRHYIAAFYSGMARALTTVQEALMAIDHGVIDVPKEPGFGYAWAEDPRYPIGDAMNRVRDLIAGGAEETVQLWLDAWGGPAYAIRGRFLGTLEKWAIYYALHPTPDCDLRILVGSHSPTAELACLDPTSTPRLREADGVSYVMEVDTETLVVTMISSEVFRRPDDV